MATTVDAPKEERTPWVDWADQAVPASQESQAPAASRLGRPLGWAGVCLLEMNGFCAGRGPISGYSISGTPRQAHLDARGSHTWPTRVACPMRASAPPGPAYLHRSTATVPDTLTATGAPGFEPSSRGEPNSPLFASSRQIGTVRPPGR